MPCDRPDRGAEAEEPEPLLEQPEPARRRWPAAIAALAALAAAAALLCLPRGGPMRAGSSLVRLASEATTNTSYINPFEDNYCPVSGENCTATRCCAEAGFQCYKKNSAWASCRKNCTRGKKMPGDSNKDPWDCEEFGARTPGPVHEDWSTGAVRGQDCRARAFCAGMDDHCYLKNKEWGSCMQECDPSAAGTKGWDCEQVY